VIRKTPSKPLAAFVNSQSATPERRFGHIDRRNIRRTVFTTEPLIRDSLAPTGGCVPGVPLSNEPNAAQACRASSDSSFTSKGAQVLSADQQELTTTPTPDCTSVCTSSEENAHETASAAVPDAPVDDRAGHCIAPPIFASTSAGNGDETQAILDGNEVSSPSPVGAQGSLLFVGIAQAPRRPESGHPRDRDPLAAFGRWEAPRGRSCGQRCCGYCCCRALSISCPHAIAACALPRRSSSG